MTALNSKEAQIEHISHKQPRTNSFRYSKDDTYEFTLTFNNIESEIMYLGFIADISDTCRYRNHAIRISICNCNILCYEHTIP